MSTETAAPLVEVRNLQRVFDEISAIPAVTRTTSSIVLRSHLQNRTLDLFEKVCGADAGAEGRDDAEDGEDGEAEPRARAS